MADRIPGIYPKRGTEWGGTVFGCRHCEWEQSVDGNGDPYMLCDDLLWAHSKTHAPFADVKIGDMVHARRNPDVPLCQAAVVTGKTPQGIYLTIFPIGGQPVAPAALFTYDITCEQAPAMTWHYLH